MKYINKTLEQLDGEDWGRPSYDSHLVQTTFALRKKALKDFTTEDLRIMIGQNFSLEYLVPIALDRLKENILTDGDLYHGDLLQSVLRADLNYWLNNLDKYRFLKQLYGRKKEFIVSRIGASELPSINKETFKGIEATFASFSEIKGC
ncbi:contact-dependent growth inhibition system immunity protein [Paracnuella aquatica]|uniref:contact-dependent growth inhibition system immunity protein n=1 Tax=Paracnuella aquatica TaxID=2268757 RepID=UPI000DF01EE2|nr:contact-dependent growth inhibition system immunity protein [Paracnuella aquatica]RPD43404.1 hypothetical protein DRJ53_20345 [Paracnuella aquatica]